MPVRMQQRIFVERKPMRKGLPGALVGRIRRKDVRHRDLVKNRTWRDRIEKRFFVLRNRSRKRKPLDFGLIFVFGRNAHAGIHRPCERDLRNELHMERQQDRSGVRCRFENLRLRGETRNRNDVEFGRELFANLERKPFGMVAGRFRDHVFGLREHDDMQIRVFKRIRMERKRVRRDRKRRLWKFERGNFRDGADREPLFPVNPYRSRG